MLKGENGVNSIKDRDLLVRAACRAVFCSEVDLGWNVSSPEDITAYRVGIPMPQAQVRRWFR